MSRKRSTRMAALAVILAVFIIWLWWGNRTIGISRYEIGLDGHPELDGFTIAQVSDLHDKEFGAGSEGLLRLLSAGSPDIIAVTGDLISREDQEFGTAMDFISKAQSIAPVYFVPGNHEAYHERYAEVIEALLRRGVTVLANEEVYVEYGSSKIRLIGIEDPAFLEEWGQTEAFVMERTLGGLMSDDEAFTLLLSHRPEFFRLYTQHGADLVLTGHAHGGQIRLPFIGALAAPGQGWFPAYTEGVHEARSTRMVVSRGLGNSVIPFRINNPPELVLITLADTRSEGHKENTGTIVRQGPSGSVK